MENLLFLGVPILKHIRVFHTDMMALNLINYFDSLFQSVNNLNSAIFSLSLLLFVVIPLLFRNFRKFLICLEYCAVTLHVPNSPARCVN